MAILGLSAPVYESEVTQFLKDLKAHHPQIETQQQAGRALLWDKPPRSLDEQSRQALARVPQRPYVYQSN
ncbi:MAG: hypothetical protein RL483_1132 [Pseudomonadota bacterium]|jgi:hypothetical protein